MKKKLVQKLTGTFIITLAAGTIALSGCSQNGQIVKETKGGASMEAEGHPMMDENAVLGKVTAVEGNTVTVALAEMPQMGERPDGETPDGAPQDGEAPNGVKPDGDPSETQTAEDTQTDETAAGTEEDGDSSAPDKEERPDGEMHQGGRQMELTLTGEEQEVTVTDSTTYTINGEEGSLKDLQVDDIITLVLADDGTAESIQSGMGQGRGGNFGGPDGAPGEDESAAASGDTV